MSIFIILSLSALSRLHLTVGIWRKTRTASEKSASNIAFHRDMPGNKSVYKYGRKDLSNICTASHTLQGNSKIISRIGESGLTDFAEDIYCCCMNDFLHAG
ncbi:hypothetical protein MJ579_04860 [Klebsiella pneumoniae]|nr:hypothetical protein MJ579_04860 [Klebsiella pneumoniae]